MTIKSNKQNSVSQKIKMKINKHLKYISFWIELLGKKTYTNWYKCTCVHISPPTWSPPDEVKCQPAPSCSPDTSSPAPLAGLAEPPSPPGASSCPGTDDLSGPAGPSESAEHDVWPADHSRSPILYINHLLYHTVSLPTLMSYDLSRKPEIKLCSGGLYNPLSPLPFFLLVGLTVWDWFSV